MSVLGCVCLYMTNKPYEPQKRTSQAHAFFGSKQSICLMRDLFLVAVNMMMRGKGALTT